MLQDHQRINTMMDKSSLLLCAFLQLLSSCAQDFSLDSGERTIVVECILSCDSIQTLKLFYSHAKDENTASVPITEAKLILFDETKDLAVGIFRNDGKDWVLDYAAEPEHSYRLDIDVKGHEHISAQQTMPKQAHIEGYVHMGGPFSSDSRFVKYGGDFYGTGFFASNLPAKTWICALTYDEKTGESHVVDEICTDYPYLDNFNLTGDVYAPYRIMWETSHGEYPFDVCKYLMGFPLYRRYLRTNADLMNSDKADGIFIICGSFYDCNNPDYAQPLGSKGGIFFTTVSDDYDRYLLEAIHYQQLQESSDMTTIYKRDNIFSNIKGGIGIFGAKTEYRSDWVMKPYSVLVVGE